MIKLSREASRQHCPTLPPYHTHSQAHRTTALKGTLAAGNMQNQHENKPSDAHTGCLVPGDVRVWNLQVGRLDAPDVLGILGDGPVTGELA